MMPTSSIKSCINLFLLFIVTYIIYEILLIIIFILQTNMSSIGREIEIDKVIGHIMRGEGMENLKLIWSTYWPSRSGGAHPSPAIHL